MVPEAVGKRSTRQVRVEVEDGPGGPVVLLLKRATGWSWDGSYGFQWFHWSVCVCVLFFRAH